MPPGAPGNAVRQRPCPPAEQACRAAERPDRRSGALRRPDPGTGSTTGRTRTAQWRRTDPWFSPVQLAGDGSAECWVVVKRRAQSGALIRLVATADAHLTLDRHTDPGTALEVDMDVRFVWTARNADKGKISLVSRHPVEDIPDLLARTDGLVWVDIPSWDDEAKRVLTDVFCFHPLAIR